MIQLAEDIIEFAPEWEIVEEPSAPVAAGGWTYRDYQLRSFEAVQSAWDSGARRILVVQATGTGKTVLFTKLGGNVVKGGGKVLMVAHNDELLEQAKDKLDRSTVVTATPDRGDKKGLFEVLDRVTTPGPDGRRRNGPAFESTLIPSVRK